MDKDESPIICEKMLEQRGYKILQNDEIILAENQVIKDKLVVFFCRSDKFNISDFKRYISQTQDLELTHCIIIYKDQITPSVNKQIDNFDCEVELFCKNELQYNITKHKFVPLHEKLSEEDGGYIRRKHGSNLPIILKSDPVSRFFNYKKGDIIKITRDNNIIAFRIVK